MKLKKILSVLLAIVMIIGMLPCQVSATTDLTWSGGTITLASGTTVGSATLKTLDIYKQGAYTNYPEIINATQDGNTINITLAEETDRSYPMQMGFSMGGGYTQNTGNTCTLKNGQGTATVTVTCKPSSAGNAPVLGTGTFTVNFTVVKKTVYTVTLTQGEGYSLSGQATSYADEPYTFSVFVDDAIYWADKIEVLVDGEKVDIVPKDGVIFAEKTVTFYEGESVFNLLIREMKRNKIHIEFENTPIYNSAYIEGIANLYEFDCGELSGWMYKVNDWFPNYGCSRYQLKAGDKVEWVYTCDLGVDVGGNYSARNGN